jgi:asparagine synthase (glutamine-hydrolysing)
MFRSLPSATEAMCGIAGILTTSLSCEEAGRAVERMTDAVRHRGPDDAGVAIVSRAPHAPSVILGHRRLAIIDLSSAGRQPMSDGEGRWITYNGEIYNYRELRSELQSLGAVFRTGTDTEVILRAHSQWGNDAFRRLRGIFALALWNDNEKELTLARDHLGVKPLYLWEAGGTLLFASEVRGLLASGHAGRRLSVAGLRSLLAFGSVQDPETLVDGVRSLLPGHVATWKNGTFREASSWSIPVHGAGETVVRPDEAFETLRHALRDAVASQLVSDVPLGVFLSGGIDSSIVAALAQQASSRPVRTLGIAFEDPRHDEREYARMVASHIGSDHHELVLTGNEVQRSLPAAMVAMDQPSVDGLNTYFVSRLAREAGLTVALSGLGGDEVFGGYEGYAHIRRAEELSARGQAMPRAVRKVMAAGLRRWPFGSSATRVAELLTAEIPYAASRSLFDTGRARALLRPDLRARADQWRPQRIEALHAETSGMDTVSRASMFELSGYMLSTLLRDTDQMSMAHALEVRVPLLDPLLVEAVFALPGALRLEPGRPKPMLTRTFPGMIPEAAIQRRKRGFALPYADWFRKTLRNEIRDEMEAGADGPFDAGATRKLLLDFHQGRLSWSRLWGVFVAKRWIREQELAV